MEALIKNHEYKVEPLHYGIEVKKGWNGSDIYPDRIGCLCGRSKEDRIHQSLKVDSF